MNQAQALRCFRLILLVFIVGLVVSGVTAFPLVWEVRLLARWLGVGDAPGPDGYTGLLWWILTVREGLERTDAAYPWMAYGTDWLAFAHLVIAVFFVAPYRHPVGSRATLQAGVAACALVVPLALICGPVRGIPFYWQLIDCAFGVFGVLPLLYCLRLLRIIERADDSPGPG